MKSNRTITINGTLIGEKCAPYIVAEMSANHNGNIDTAFRLIEEAKRAGADAVKIQTYRPDTLTIDCNKADFLISDGIWQGRTLYELYDWAHTPWEWHAPLFEFADKVGITIFSSPFDPTAVDLLEDLNTPAYKIASFEMIDLALISYVASTRKPMIISTGMANACEIQEAIEVASDAGCRQICVLHCVSAYPVPIDDCNLRTIPDLINRFGLVTGLSDHSLDNTAAIASVALGASIIEKHFTLDRNAGGPDDVFSLEPDNLAQLCRDSEYAWKALGGVNYAQTGSEKNSIKFRRSLYVVKPIEKGERFTVDNVKSIRPGYGLAPKALHDVLTTVAAKDLSVGTALTKDCLHIE